MFVWSLRPGIWCFASAPQMRTRADCVNLNEIQLSSPMRLLDRYVIRSFLQVYLYCIAGFFSIWLIFDISDNISTFIDEHFGLTLTVKYYATQVPEVFIILLPVSLLLALLFSLGRMSRANEIVSMLTAGVSLSRTLRPLLVIGLFTTLVSLGLNYSAAPHAELARRNYLSTGKSMEGNQISGEVFRNRKDARTWFIQSFQPGENVFYNVQILQQDEQDNIVTNYLAARALYRPDTTWWELEAVKVVNYDNAGNITRSEILPSITLTNWNETPARLGSANVRAELLSLPE